MGKLKQPMKFTKALLIASISATTQLSTAVELE